MMLAYQPVRSLSTLNMIINQGLSAASRILPIIDKKNNIINHPGSKPIIIKDANIKFKSVNFSYDLDDDKTLKLINITKISQMLQQE